MIKLLACSLLVGLTAAWGQNEVKLLDQRVNPAQVLQELPPPPPGRVGTHYLHEDWRPGTLHLKSGAKLENYPLRYDLAHQALEIQAGETVKICPVTWVDRLEWTDPATGRPVVFVNRSQFQFNGQPPEAQLLELLVADKAQLLVAVTTAELPPNYTPALDMGNKAIRVTKKETLLLAKDQTIYPITARKEKNAELFGPYAATVMQYARDNKLRLTNREEAAAIVRYYASLLP